MKVLLQHPTRPNEISGVATFVANAEVLLEQIGVEVRAVCTSTASWQETKEAVEWADVVHLSSNHARAFFHAKWKGKPVILHYHFPFGGSWKRSDADRRAGFYGRLWLSSRNCWNHGKGKRLTPGFWIYLLKHTGRAFMRVLFCRFVDVRIACSEFIRNDSKIPWPVLVIPYGFDFDALAAWREKPFASESLFSFVGRVTPEKGIDTLIEAVALVKKDNIPVHLHVIGDGDDLENSKERARELGLKDNITFHGRKDWTSAMAIVSQCATLVIPSNYDDASPYVVTEAYALKRAVIGSNRGGIPEQIGPGPIFPAGDAAELAARMRLFATDVAYARRMGKEGYEFARQRSSGHATKLLEIYRKLAPSA